ncbi:hypothetical protein AKJ41_05705 [candidate division MSBL1 archaeon SCGC-AAA259O05]|uniref:Radical SAM core domain-containing protein n=1 Tax=candidate division MSBL1 archaeon SCGC-AAA259O05 TaxID=1698271 RepID=A0A133UYI3_9EURY|nr:hypothetical protein AKJ41_05705 [candidate division MSBL1 archaeon SCGC-AAA259O05]
MYACSPEGSENWIEPEKIEGVMDYLSEKIQAPRMGPKSVGLNSGLHYTGGEPFLNYNLLLNLVKMGNRFDIPGIFVETNCFWCREEETVVERFLELKEARLDGVLVSVNPFTAGHVPLENTLAAIEAGKEVFGSNLLIYQKSFLDRMRRKDVEGTVPLEKSLELIGSSMFKTMEMLPRGGFPTNSENFIQRIRRRNFSVSAARRN